jgi:hypothetical protein
MASVKHDPPAGLAQTFRNTTSVLEYAAVAGWLEKMDLRQSLTLPSFHSITVA